MDFCNILKIKNLLECVSFWITSGLSEQCDNRTVRTVGKWFTAAFPGVLLTLEYMYAVRRRVLWRWLHLIKYGEVWMFSLNLSSYLIIRPHTPSRLPLARDARGRSFGSIVQKPGGFCLPSWSWIMSVMRSARRSHLSAALFQWFMVRSYLVAAANKRRDFTRAYMKQPALCVLM